MYRFFRIGFILILLIFKMENTQTYVRQAEKLIGCGTANDPDSVNFLK